MIEVHYVIIVPPIEASGERNLNLGVNVGVLQDSVGNDITSNPLCAHFPGPGTTATIEIIKCDMPMIGNVVYIQQRTSTHYDDLLLNELLIYGIKGRFNIHCRALKMRSICLWPDVAAEAM